MTEHIQRAIRHEAGHAVAGLHFGFQVARLCVKDGVPLVEADLDSSDRTAKEKFVFLAAGIAAEEFFYSNYDSAGCRRDALMISERGGGKIETYLPEARGIIQVNESRLRHVVKKLETRMQEECAEAAFAAAGSLDAPEPVSFDLLSREQLLNLWCRG